jgi:site-specific recombinase XerD
VTVPTVNRLRVLIVLLWRAGVRISEALALHKSDPRPLPRRGASFGEGKAASGARLEWIAGHGAGVRRRFAPHQLRHAHAVEMVHERVRSW